MKNRKNTGLANLKNLNVSNITKNANLRENVSEENITALIHTEIKKKTKLIPRQINIPEKMNHILKEALEECKITGSVTSYMIEATREKMIKDGLLKI